MSTRDSWARADFETATRLVVEGYGPQILGYLVRTMRNESDACEVFSRFCEQLWRGIEKFEGRSSFKTWAYCLATHARTRFWEDPYRKRAAPMESSVISKLEQQVRSQTMRYLRSEVKDRFARIRANLSSDEQSLLTLRVDKGLSWTEIAQILASPEEACPESELKLRTAALRQRFQRLKEKIRELAEEDGLLDTVS